jgi:hypothetical protein
MHIACALSNPRRATTSCSNEDQVAADVACNIRLRVMRLALRGEVRLYGAWITIDALRRFKGVS